MNSSTGEVPDYQDSSSSYNSTFKLPTYVIAVYGIAYCLIFFIAVLGNIMVVIVIVKTQRMHTVTNLFIANLALADILVALICMPITFLDNIYTGWPFGAVLCKMTQYIQGVSVCASVYSLVAIAVDRFLAICFHPRWRIVRSGAFIILCLIWLISVTLLLPWTIYSQQEKWDESINICVQLWPDYDSQRAYFVVAIVIGTYLLPLSVIFTCYFLIAWRVCHRSAPGVAMDNGMIRRSKINVVKMLFTVVLMFALSFLPLHLLHVILFFHAPTMLDLDPINEIGIPLAQWLALSNSGMNAFIYSFFSGNFRRGFLHLWYCIKKKYLRHRIIRTPSEDSTMVARYSVHRKHATGFTNGAIALTNRFSLSRSDLRTLSQTAVTTDSLSWSSDRNQS